jgi:hypothetical protein
MRTDFIKGISIVCQPGAEIGTIIPTHSMSNDGVNDIYAARNALHSANITSLVCNTVSTSSYGQPEPHALHAIVSLNPPQILRCHAQSSGGPPIRH